MKRFILLFFAMCSIATGIHASKFGYTDGTYSRTNIFRMGSTTKQGMAIRLSHEKLERMKGVTINGIEAVFGTRNTTNKQATLFISTNPDGTPLVEKTIDISKAASWLSFDIDPYTITGEEEELYIGYYAEVGTTYLLLSCDYSKDIKGCCYAYKDGQWTDIYGYGFGAVNIKAVTSDYTATDMLAKPLKLDGYFKAGTPYIYEGQIINIGTENINSFDITLTMDNGEGMTNSITGLDIPQGGTYEYTLPETTALKSGKMVVKAEITNVNGGEDFDSSDNSTESELFFYPEEMERSIMLEGFTGQDCSNCPAGHLHINNVVEASSENIVEVMHHSGYYPDIFTMDEDLDYTFFFGSGSVYTPAVMVNRTAFPALSDVPTFNTEEDNISWAINEAANTQPYVSLKLETSYDQESREVNVSVEAYAHNDLPAEKNIINVFMTQDNILANQTNGGSSYNHSAVLRGVLTGNSWGLLLPNGKAGERHTWSKTFTLPEEITSSGWTESMLESAGMTKDDVTIPVVVDDMNIIAYVAAYESSNTNGNYIYNCVKAKLGESYEQDGFATSIKGIEREDSAPEVKIKDGQIAVVGDYKDYSVYGISGKAMAKNGRLMPGLYIVKIDCNGKNITKKVLVR